MNRQSILSTRQYKEMIQVIGIIIGIMALYMTGVHSQAGFAQNWTTP